MKLTKDDVARIAAMVPAAEVTAKEDGIRLYRCDCYGAMPVVGDIMAAALTLKLDPTQIHCNVQFEAPVIYSEYTSDSESATIDVTFYWDKR